MGKIVGAEMISINKIATDSVEKDFSFPREFHSGGGIIIFSTFAENTNMKFE
jgi:hypothetical protein